MEHHYVWCPTFADCWVGAGGSIPSRRRIVGHVGTAAGWTGVELENELNAKSSRVIIHTELGRTDMFLGEWQEGLVSFIF
jgi:hypothetical protein